MLTRPVHRLAPRAWRAAIVWLALGPLSAALAGSMDPLPGTQPGDAVRGAAIVASRQNGLCLLCHSAPLGDARLQGNLGPSLSGAGTRWTAGQLRQRVADASSLNPDTVMPSYRLRPSGSRTPPALADRPLLDDQQIEDIVAYLLTLRDP